MRRARRGGPRRYWIKETSLYRFSLLELSKYAEKTGHSSADWLMERNFCPFKGMHRDREYGPWLTRKEAADYIRATTKTIDRLTKVKLLKRKKLKGMRIWRISRAELDALFF